MMWAGLVGPGKPWDLKIPFENERAYRVMVGGWMVDAAVAGNIHYGYVGRAARFSTFELLTAGGAAQRIGNYPSCGRWETYGDDPSDFMAVAFGAYLYNVYGADITEREFRQTFNVWASTGIFDRATLYNQVDNGNIYAWLNDQRGVLGNDVVDWLLWYLN